MSLDNAYNAALGALALEINVNASALIKNQTIVVDGVTLSFSAVASASGASIQCVCKVEGLSQQLTVRLLRTLLQANTLGQITMGSTFGLQFGANAIVLGQRYPMDIPVAALARACRVQCEISRIWATALAEGVPPGSEALVDTVN